MASNDDTTDGDNFKWSWAHLEIFGELATEYLRIYGRGKIRWKEIMDKFNFKTGLKLPATTFKNKWDAMKKDSSLWRHLKGNETGLGWDAKNHKLLCSDEWWEKKNKEKPGCKKFRGKSVRAQLEDLWNRLFEDSYANGDDEVAPGMDIGPMRTMNEEGEEEENMTGEGSYENNGDIGSYVYSEYNSYASRLENLEGDDNFYSSFMSEVTDLTTQIPRASHMSANGNQKGSEGLTGGSTSQGRYYLVDKGYPDRQGYLVPYSRVRYHQSQFEQEPPSNSQEAFNRAHSSLRSCVERSFGVLKKRWKILNQMPQFSKKTQIDVIMAAFALHNYIRRNSQDDLIFTALEKHPNYISRDEVRDVNGNATGNKNDRTRGQSSGMREIRNNIATSIWNDRHST